MKMAKERVRVDSRDFRVDSNMVGHWHANFAQG